MKWKVWKTLDGTWCAISPSCAEDPYTVEAAHRGVPLLHGGWCRCAWKLGSLQGAMNHVDLMEFKKEVPC